MPQLFIFPSVFWSSRFIRNSGLSKKAEEKKKEPEEKPKEEEGENKFSKTPEAKEQKHGEKKLSLLEKIESKFVDYVDA